MRNQILSNALSIHLPIFQMTIEYHFYKSLFAPVWLVPELMIQYRGYFCWQVFATETEHIYFEEDHPFHNFSSVSVHFWTAAEYLYYKDPVLYSFLCNPSKLWKPIYIQQLVLTSPVVLLFGAGDIICKCIKQILITNCYY